MFIKKFYITTAVFIVYSLIEISFAESFAPSFISSLPNRIEGYIGDSLKVLPNVCGSKPLVYKWLKNDSVIQSSSKSLIFKNLSKDNQGNYMCIVRNEFGSDTSDIFQIDVIQKLNAKFTMNRNKGNAPLKVYFLNKSEGSIKNITWSFGDGTFSNLENPIHTFNSSGTFYIKLTVTGDQIPDTSIMVKKIEIVNTELIQQSDKRKSNISDNENSPKNKKTAFLLPRFFIVKHCGGDSIRIVFHNSNQNADSIFLWYGKGKNPDFSDSSHTKRIDPGFFHCESDTDSLAFVIRDSCFEYNNDFNVALIFKENGYISDTALSPVIFETNSRKNKIAENKIVSNFIFDERIEKDSSTVQKEIDMLTEYKYQTDKNNNQGCVFEVFITNKSDHIDTVKHAVNLISSMSENFSVETIDPLTANPVDFLILNSSESKRILIIAGTNSYRDSIKKQIGQQANLLKNNFFKNCINSCKLIPYNKSGRVLLMVPDRYGRCLWQYSLLEIYGGINEFILYRRSAKKFSILPSVFYLFKSII